MHKWQSYMSQKIPAGAPKEMVIIGTEEITTKTYYSEEKAIVFILRKRPSFLFWMLNFLIFSILKHEDVYSLFLNVSNFVCVCVYVRERERESQPQIVNDNNSPRHLCLN